MAAQAADHRLAVVTAWFDRCGPAQSFVPDGHQAAVRVVRDATSLSTMDLRVMSEKPRKAGNGTETTLAKNLCDVGNNEHKKLQPRAAEHTGTPAVKGALARPGLVVSRRCAYRRCQQARAALFDPGS
ncbi:hypothetical protein [Amycolatopsis orientalis]|uniref:hypothetical protein n=1 Tax=Amycolatopsis orientalis TaxID=31958 RepID=UPI00039FFF18|nr:hypothetical protein [Amycolatopsis orientalis]